MTGPTALTGARIFDGFRIQIDSALLFADDRIVVLIPADRIPTGYRTIRLAGGLLAPGFIDLQINGGGGVLLNNVPTEQTMLTMAQSQVPFGVTRILPTVISDSVEVTDQAISAAQRCVKQDSGVLGIHIEGPFFSGEKSGVHRADKIRALVSGDWLWLERLAGLPSILTLAPERVSAEAIARIAALGVRICAGHSNASSEQVVAAHEQGLSGFTHLYNAMSQLTGREPGVVGAALTLTETWAGLIADGIHVHPTSIQTALNSKGFERIFLVSDAMATVGSPLTQFELYGETIQLREGRLINAQGRLAGSAISLLEAVKYCLDTLNLPLHQALAMASRIPAEYMQLDHQYGSFQPGRRADICLINDAWGIDKVWRSGQAIAF